MFRLGFFFTGDFRLEERGVVLAQRLSPVISQFDGTVFEFAGSSHRSGPTLSNGRKLFVQFDATSVVLRTRPIDRVTRRKSEIVVFAQRR